MLTSAAEWFRDQCDAEDEESAAFKDAITSGMGWTETRLDRSANPDEWVWKNVNCATRRWQLPNGGERPPMSVSS